MKAKRKFKDYEKMAEEALLLIFLILLVYHSMQFVYQIHNLDLIHNINYLVSKVNEAGFISSNNQTLYIPFESISDKGSDFIERPLKDYYISSVNSLEKYFLYIFFDALLIGLILGRKL